MEIFKPESTVEKALKQGDRLMIKLIITLLMLGNVPTKEFNPAIPISPRMKSVMPTNLAVN